MLQSPWWFILVCYIIIWNKDSKLFCCRCVLIELFQPQVGSRVSGGLLSCPYGYSERESGTKLGPDITTVHPVVNEQHSCTVTNIIHSSLGYVEFDTVLLEVNLTVLHLFFQILLPCITTPTLIPTSFDLALCIWHKCLMAPAVAHLN